MGNDEEDGQTSAPTAGEVVTFDYPDAPPHLAEIVDAEGNVPKGSVFIPQDYTAEGKFPLLIWNSGGSGGHGTGLGWPRSFLEEKGFVVINLPLWQEDFKREDFTGDPEVEGDENWLSLLIEDEDAEVNWRMLRRLLDDVFALVPNIDRSRIFMGGFSNGAHVAAVYLNDEGEVGRAVNEVARGFLFIEGGSGLKAAERLEGRPVLVAQGVGEDGKRLWLNPLRERLEAAGAQVAYIPMKGVEHKMPEENARQVGQWLREQAGLEHAAAGDQ